MGSLQWHVIYFRSAHGIAIFFLTNLGEQPHPVILPKNSFVDLNYKARFSLVDYMLVLF